MKRHVMILALLGAGLLFAGRALLAAADEPAATAAPSPGTPARDARPAPPPAPPASCVVTGCCAPDRMLSRDRVHWRVGLFTWFAGMESTTQVGPATFDADMSFSEIFAQLAVSVMGGIAARWREWTLDVRGMYLRMEDGLEIQTVQGPVPVETVFEQGIVTAQLGYEAARWSTGCGPCGGCASLDVYAGLRYYTATTEVTFGALPSVSDTNEWVDPIVGARLNWRLSPRLGLALEGDVGGFGAGSELSWHLRVGVDYALSRVWGLVAGYNVLSWDYERSDFGWDATLYGPYVGIEVRF